MNWLQVEGLAGVDMVNVDQAAHAVQNSIWTLKVYMIDTLHVRGQDFNNPEEEWHAASC